MNHCKRFCLLLMVLLLLPVSSLAGVTGYSVQNPFGAAPQTIEIVLDTTEDIRGVKHPFDEKVVVAELLDELDEE